MSFEKRRYQQLIFLTPKEGSFDEKAITSYAKERVHRVYEDPSNHRVLLLCFTQDAQNYVADWLLTESDNPRRPGVPIIVFTNHSIEVAAGYDETDNEAIRPILAWIANKWPTEVRSEWNTGLAVDFSEYPVMRDLIPR